MAVARNHTDAAFLFGVDMSKMTTLVVPDILWPLHPLRTADDAPITGTALDFETYDDAGSPSMGHLYALQKPPEVLAVIRVSWDEKLPFAIKAFRSIHRHASGRFWIEGTIQVFRGGNERSVPSRIRYN